MNREGFIHESTKLWLGPSSYTCSTVYSGPRSTSAILQGQLATFDKETSTISAIKPCSCKISNI